MIIHCTKKLAGKLPEVSDSPLHEENTLGSWHANLYFIDRRQCLLLCHDITRFALFIPALKKADFARLDFWFRDCLANTMLKLGYSEALILKAQIQIGKLRFDTHCDRSVLGTLNIMRQYDLHGFLMSVPNVMDLPMYTVSAHLCDRPVHVKGMKTSQYLWPADEMKNQLMAI